MSVIEQLEESGQTALHEAAAARLKQFADDNAARRLWAHDPTLWTDDEAGQAEIRKRLGWLEAPARSQALLADLARVVQEVQSAGLTHAVLLGMGGSSLAPEVLSQIFGSLEVNGKPGLELIVLDSTNPVQVRAAARWSDLARTLYIVSSKSGTTIEIDACLNYFWTRARRKLGDRAGDHFIAITDPGAPLDQMARAYKFRRVFLADPTVGGRNAALTAFGLAPAALMGIDAARLLNRAAWMAEQCSADRPASSNPGLALGAVLSAAALQGRDKLTILADPPIEAFGAWLEQLIAESSGKQGRGIVPVDIEPAAPPRKYGADRLFVYLKLGIGDLLVEKRVVEIRKAGQPVLTIAIPDVYELGAEFFRWETATAFACAALRVNSFDQPDVQDQKIRTEQRVAVFVRDRSMDEGQPVWEGPGGRVYGWNFPGLNGADTLADVVRAFIALSREDDYIALNAYLPRNERVLNQLQALRAKILKATGRATTLGFGPRFLHSTGQLHKGGANNGMFLQITQRPPVDIDIPTRQMTFGRLLRAQALGDLDALMARGRRVIRIALVDGTLKDLLP